MNSQNPLASTHEYDDGDWMVNNWLWKQATHLARAESMDVTNDPRFFAGNVMDKRLTAFKSLTLVSSIMFGTALSQCFALKKDMDFSKVEPLVGNLAMWQIIAFFLALAVAIQCLLSLYIIAQQLFYVYRLMTAGSLGFDLAAIFYLTRTITMWRHLAIKLLFNGMLKFLVLVGIQLFVTFYMDASAVKSKHEAEMVVNMANLTVMGHTAEGLHLPPPTHVLSMKVHVGLGYLCLLICTVVALVMYRIRAQHQAVFGENYKHAEQLTHPLERTVADMGTRSGHFVET
jgi:hypothetical protein